ncbi:hypothetical protein ACFLZT_04890 [Thermodesulfobacteriota bacterium]
MDDDTAKYISVLVDINKALTIGLESAILLMDKWDEITPEQKEAVIKNLTVIIAKSKSTIEVEPE